MPDVHFPVHSQQSARLVSLNGVQVREDTLYTNHKGEEKKGIRKHAEKALDKLQEILRKVLGQDEVALYVARCQAPIAPLEQLTLGAYASFVTGSVLVFTNRRLLHLLVKSDVTWRKVIRAVGWGDIEEAKVKGWWMRTLQLKYRDGKKETYRGIPANDGKKIESLLTALFASGAGDASAALGMVSLCPSCLARLTPRVYECAQCHAGFKDEGTMIRRSWLIPGGGFFYVGQRFLGFADFIAEAILLVLFVIYVLVALGGMVDPFVEPGQMPATSEEAWFIAGFLAVLLALEKWLTIRDCRRLVREFIPIE